MNNKPSWRDDFDEQFPGMLSEATDDGGYNARPYVKHFIQSLLDKQREELREWAEGNKPVGEATNHNTYNDGKRDFCNDLLTKLEKE